MALISCGIVTLGFLIGVGWDKVGGGNKTAAVSGYVFSRTSILVLVPARLASTGDREHALAELPHH